MSRNECVAKLLLLGWRYGLQEQVLRHPTTFKTKLDIQLVREPLSFINPMEEPEFQYGDTIQLNIEAEADLHFTPQSLWTYIIEATV